MFSDQLETQMKDTEVAGTYKNLFAGKLQNVIKCINVDFESTRDEVFNTLQLSVQGNPSIEDSIRQYVAQEKLEGDNQYETEKDGKQDAKKFIRFKELPPVL
jgi:ubiquitin carboxyl-terminal hydrolase 7|tara:strand:- start:1005 stop:1310 length:306 start_codon:yes stop_codon:yes gene_type:complete